MGRNLLQRGKGENICTGGVLRLRSALQVVGVLHRLAAVHGTPRVAAVGVGDDAVFAGADHLAGGDDVRRRDACAEPRGVIAYDRGPAGLHAG